jgi:hypothetical protein
MNIQCIANAFFNLINTNTFFYSYIVEYTCEFNEIRGKQIVQSKQNFGFELNYFGPNDTLQSSLNYHIERELQHANRCKLCANSNLGENHIIHNNIIVNQPIILALTLNTYNQSNINNSKGKLIDLQLVLGNSVYQLACVAYFKTNIHYNAIIRDQEGNTYSYDSMKEGGKLCPYKGSIKFNMPDDYHMETAYYIKED